MNEGGRRREARELLVRREREKKGREGRKEGRREGGGKKGGREEAQPP